METLDVYFTPRMVASPRSFSPSARKPLEVVEDWKEKRLPITIHAPSPLSERELSRAHDARYVRDVLACRAPNGFGDRSPEVAASLPYTSGAMLAAARRAIETGAVACAPCSGFHHAGWDHGAGFCTFNGLMVTACALLAEGARSIGILDCDMHDGDGTDEILDRLALRDRVVHFTAGGAYHRPAQAEAFLARLPSIVEAMRACDVVLYQAGADPHVEDPLGGWLDDAQLARRDAIVFATARELGVPVAWNLAGGYRRDARGTIAPVLAVHEATARACLRIYDDRETAHAAARVTA